MSIRSSRFRPGRTVLWVWPSRVTVEAKIISLTRDGQAYISCASGYFTVPLSELRKV